MNAPIDVTNIQIETARLLLRPWKMSDLQDLYEYASVPGVGEMAGWTHHQSIEESASILDMFIEHRKTLALELKENGKVIGSICLEDIDFPDDRGMQGREVGYALSKTYWGKGLMPEAVKAVIDYFFEKLHYDWLTCGHFVWNTQSCRVVEKCGFRYVRDTIRETRFNTEEPMKLYVLCNPHKEI